MCGNPFKAVGKFVTGVFGAGAGVPRPGRFPRLPKPPDPILTRAVATQRSRAKGSAPREGFQGLTPFKGPTITGPGFFDEVNKLLAKKKTPGFFDPQKKARKRAGQQQDLFARKVALRNG